MQNSTVKWFDAKKGFGFIVGPDGQDVFVHFSVIQSDGYRTLKDGEAVEFEFERGSKGLLATSVRRLAPPRRKRRPASKRKMSINRAADRVSP